MQLFTLAERTNPQLATFVMLAASTGARRGEMLALRRSDLDLDRGVVAIERGIVIAQREIVEQGTKTHQTRRVTIDGATTANLRRHLRSQDALARTLPTLMRRDPFVFSNSIDGSEPWRPDSTTRAFRSLCVKAGVPGVRLHDLRHYVATRLLTSGVDARTVAGRLGHRNPSTTLNVYAHFVPESDQNAAATLASLFSGAMDQVNNTVDGDPVVIAEPCRDAVGAMGQDDWGGADDESSQGHSL